MEVELKRVLCDYTTTCLQLRPSYSQSVSLKFLAATTIKLCSAKFVQHLATPLPSRADRIDWWWKHVAAFWQLLAWPGSFCLLQPDWQGKW